MSELELASGPTHAWHTSIVFIGQVVAAIGAFGATLVIARTLGPSGRGVYAFAVTVGSLVAVAGQMGLVPAVLFATAGARLNRRHIRRLYFQYAGIGTLLLGLAVSSAVTTDHHLLPNSGGAHATAFFIGPIALAITIFDGALSFRTAEGRFSQAALMLAVGGVLPALAVLVLALTTGLSAATALAAWGGVRVVIGLASWFRPVVTAGPGALDKEESRVMRSYGRRAFAASASGIVTLRADQWVLGLISGSSVLGIYAVAVSVTDPSIYIPSALQRVLFPRVVERPGLAAEITARTIRLAVAIVGVFVVVAAPVGFALIPRVFGEAFNASRTPFLILLPGTLGLTLLILAAAATSACGRPGLASIVELGTGSVMLILDFLLIPSHGAEGAAVASTVAYSFGGVSAVITFKRVTGAQTLRVFPRRDEWKTLVGYAHRQLVRVGRGRTGDAAS